MRKLSLKKECEGFEILLVSGANQNKTVNLERLSNTLDLECGEA